MSVKKGTKFYNPNAVTKHEVEHLRRLRRMKEMSQAKLGKAVGVTKQYISRVELGVIPISREQYLKLLRAVQAYKGK